MAQFLPGSACNGHRPKRLASLLYFPRNTLLTRMMRDRGRIRYLLAPSYFGKTTLACSYAQMVFSFKNTFWVNALSPCFLRDLDEGVMASELLRLSDAGALVVFDDVPALDEVRRGELLATCDKLLAEEREIVMTSTPAADPLGACNERCLTIAPRDFLFDESDFRELRRIDAAQHHLDPPSCLADCVAGLARRETGAREHFLNACISDTADSFENALTFVILALEHGPIEDIARVTRRPVEPVDLSAEHLRPFVHVDEFRREFSAMGFYLRDVMRAFIPYMQPFSDALGMEDASQLACRIADVLVERGNPDRAAQVLVTVCEPTLRARWVARHQAQLADRCAFVALEALYASLRQTGLERQVGLRIGTAVCEGLLADAAEGTDKLTRIARKGEASLGERLIAAMAALLLSEDARAHDELCAIGMMNGVAMTDADVPAAFGSVAFFWLRTPHADGIEEVAAYVCEQAESSSVSALVAACCLKAARLKRAGDPGLWVTLMMMVERAVQRCAVERNHGGAVAVLRRELSACKKGGLSVWVPKALTDDERLDELERRLNQQRVFYARRRGSSGSMERPIASISASVDELPQVGSVPILRIHLFGRFDVTVGDAHADPALFSRQKVRTLLALLALDVGKDVSCEALCKELWPEATLAKSSHNFHSIFSLLRKAIALPSGECPYLTRSQGACSLDGMCVVSDAFELDQVCRSLRFDTSDERTFQRHYERICEIYQGEFLPGEKNEGVVAAKRDYWRNRVVDALIYAVKALVPIGEKRMALQFSRTALEYDPRREDCYGVLMAMQAICGERPHASNTWMRYCHFIDKDMGLDPSARLRTLYSQIIKDSWESEGELLADL